MANDNRDGLREALQDIRMAQQRLGDTLQASREEAAGARQQVTAMASEQALARAERAQIMERLTRAEGQAKLCSRVEDLAQRITALEAVRFDGSSLTSRVTVLETGSVASATVTALESRVTALESEGKGAAGAEEKSWGRWTWAMGALLTILGLVLAALGLRK